MEQRSQEWLDARRGLITASAVGAILGLSPYMTRDAVMRRMIREKHGAEPEFTGNIATDYGTANEAGALAEYQMETGHAVMPWAFATRDEWAGCSPDGYIQPDGGVEIKCPFGKRKEGDLKPLADQPHYLAQVQFSLWVTGRKWWDFYQWTPHQTMLERVTPDHDWQEENIPLLHDFYRAFLVEDPAPHLEAKRAEVDTLEAARMVAEYDQLTEAIENAEARKKELLADMVTRAGGRNAVFAGRNLTQVERAGSVSYAKAIAHYAPQADLEPFRGKATSYWQLK